jgi:16S rRNA (adenine1518-N6/adenine1519-N6)-dimethyltransferase
MKAKSGHVKPPAAKAKLGQNFLISQTAPRAIVAAAGNLSNAAVLEIGPGMGAITHLLAQSARRLVAIEFDHSLAERLLMQYPPQKESGDAAQALSGVDIITNDVLRVNLTALAEREGGKLVVVGNLPYYITSEILLHLFAHADALDRAVLMMQREVADRLCAEPGSRDYGLLTVTTQLYADVQRLFELTPADFSPPPNVHSTVVRLHFTPRHRELGVDPAAFVPFLRHCFAQKRKTLGNNLKAAGYPSERIDDACATASVSREARAEAVSIERLAALFQGLIL